VVCVTRGVDREETMDGSSRAGERTDARRRAIARRRECWTRERGEARVMAAHGGGEIVRAIGGEKSRRERESLAETNAEALFRTRGLEEIREIERRTRREANEKAESLRCVKDVVFARRRGGLDERVRGGRAA